MLDVHVLTLPGLPDEWIQQRRESIQASIDGAGYPVAVHEIDGERGHIGRGRQRGYRAGSYPWKAYIDDDDYVLPDAFAALVDAMTRNPAAIYTGEIVEQNGQRRSMRRRHHMAVYRRDVLHEVDLAPWFVCADWRLRQVAEKHPDGVIDIPDCVYVHRVYFDSRARSMRRDRKAELRELVANHG